MGEHQKWASCCSSSKSVKSGLLDVTNIWRLNDGGGSRPQHQSPTFVALLIIDSLPEHLPLEWPHDRKNPTPIGGYRIG